MTKKSSASILPVLLIAGLAFALTAFFLFSMRSETAVVVAARPIQVGARLSAADVKLANVRSTDVKPNAIKTLEEAVGQVISAQRLEGDQITSDMLGSQAISAISASLAPDHRAVAVRVSRSAGLAGILRPGDSVTLIGVIEPGNDAGAFASNPFATAEPTATPAAAFVPDGAGGFIPAPTVAPTPESLKPTTPFSRITATGLKVLLVPQSFRYQEVTETDSDGFAPAQASQNGQAEGVIVLDVPAAPITIGDAAGSLTLSLPELIALLDTKARVYLALEPQSSVQSPAPGISIEQLVDFGVGGQP